MMNSQNSLRTRSARRANRGFTLVELLLVLVILGILAALVLRGFRVGEPSRFQFDEVYHVRTATEFLQDWRYGEPHAIYEYTHPHLAKYAIAVGIELLGAPTVDATTQYHAPIGAIAARGASGAKPGRIWIATPSGIDVLDLGVGAIRVGQRIEIHVAVAVCRGPATGAKQ